MVTPVNDNINLNVEFYEKNFSVNTRFAGCLGFRATTCFRIVVAASPQVGGRLRALYNPNTTYRGQASAFRIDSWRDSNITGYTQLPGVEMDLESSTAVDFKIPYTSYMEYMPVRNDGNGEGIPRVNLGRFCIRDYLPIASDLTTQPVPYYTVYSWLEDIEIFGARNPKIYPYDFNVTPTFFTATDYQQQTGPNFNVVFGTLEFNPTTTQSIYSVTLVPTLGGPTISITGVAVVSADPNIAEMWATVGSSGGSPDPAFPCYGTVDSRSESINMFVSFDYDDQLIEGVIGFKTLLLDAPLDDEGEIQLQAEEDIQRDGPLSGPLYKLSQAANLVGSAIPSISSITSPLGWFTRTASNAAAAFGFSRPLQLEQSHRYWQTANHYQNNADGPDTCFNLGLLQDNKTCFSSTVGGTDVDEMAISYLTQKSVALSRFAMDTSSVGMRYTLSLSPMAMFFSSDGSPDPVVQPPITWTNVATGNVYDLVNSSPGYFSGEVVTPTPLFMLGTMFKYFRGGFRFTLKCNKTRFHGGRLMVAYTPFTKTSVSERKVWSPEQIETVVSNEADLYGHTIIWDLRESSECIIECPYIFNTPYLDCNESFGTLSVSVIDNINAPQNVSQDLVFALEVAGMEGFEFARPEQKDYVLNFGDDFRSRDSNYELPFGFSMNQRTFSEDDFRSRDSKELPFGISLNRKTIPEDDSGVVQLQSGSCPFVVDDSDKSCEAIGEKILSIKQLLSRTEWLPAEVYDNEPPSFGNISATTLRCWFQTFNGIGTQFNIATNPGYEYHYRGTYVKSTRDILTSCYMFCKGGTSYDVISDKPFAISMSTDEIPDNGLLGKGSNILEKGPYGHVKLPYYSRTTKIPTNPMTYSVTPVDSLRSTVAPTEFTDFGQAFFYGSADGTVIGIRASDDAQLGFFIGAPRLMIAKGGKFAPRVSDGSTSGGVVFGAADFRLVSN